MNKDLKLEEFYNEDYWLRDKKLDCNVTDFKKVNDCVYTFYIEHNNYSCVYLSSSFYDNASEFGENTFVLNISNVDTFLNEPEMDFSIFENKAKGLSVKITGDNCKHIIVNEVNKGWKTLVIIVINPEEI